MNLALVATELAVCAWVIVLLICDTIPALTRQHLWKLAMLAILSCAAVLAWQQPRISAIPDHMFILDRFAWSFKCLFLLTTAVVMLMTRVFADQLRAAIGEFYLLTLSALLGMLVLASVHDLLLLFIGLELLTFSLYVMAAYVRQDARSTEAGMKYLILGSVSSGFLIYGISLLYGFAGSTDFVRLRDVVGYGPLPPLAVAGLVMVLAGLGFKIAAVPFQLWVPDVYEGAPTPVVALLSVGSKMAGVVALLRLLYGVFLPAHALWGGLLAAASAATILYGNLCALPQTNIKRLLGYSSIGHAGYLLMGLATGTAFGAASVGFYLLAYLFSNLTVFFVVILSSHAIGGDQLDDYNGLAKRSPFLAAAMFIGLLSLAGVPPLAGFVGKLLVMLATVQTGRLWLVVVGAANVAVSLYYYLLIVKRMYAATPRTTEPIRIDGLSTLTLAFLVLGIVAVGIAQEPFLRFVSSAATLLPR